MNLTAKILLGLGIVILVAMTIAGLLIGQATSTAYRGYLSAMQQERLSQLAAGAADVYAQTGSWEEAQAWVDRNASILMPPGWNGGMGRGAGRGGRGPGPAAGFNPILVDPEDGAPLTGDPSPPQTTSMIPGAPVLVNGQEVAHLVLAGTRTNIGPAEQQVLDRIRRAIVFSAVAAGVAALVIGSILVTSILRPLRRLEGGVERVASGDLSARVAVTGRDEIGHLARRFNWMAANLERQEALRQRLVADIAHELRTPLSVIQGNLQAILDGVYPLEREEIETIYEETRLLARLITDLHELGQAEAGRLPLAKQPLRVSAVLEQLQKRFPPIAESRGIQFLVHDEAPNRFVDADPDRLQQIFYNLVGNALRHTPEGGVIIVDVGWSKERTDFPATNDYTKQIVFSITDSGPGIPATDLPHVFDRFYRIGDDRSRSDADELTTGSGLGLAIAKALVELHGGMIGVENAPGLGARFWFTLPEAPHPDA